MEISIVYTEKGIALRITASEEETSAPCEDFEAYFIPISLTHYYTGLVKAWSFFVTKNPETILEHYLEDTPNDTLLLNEAMGDNPRLG